MSKMNRYDTHLSNYSMTKKTTTKEVMETVTEKSSTKYNTIYEALYAFQSENISIPRNGSAQINGRQYSYAKLDDVLNITRPFLQKHNLVLTQNVKRDVLETKVILIGVSENNEIVSEVEMPKTVHPQELGIAITYIRRYSIVAILGLSLEDDVDANIPKNQPASPKVPESPTQAPEMSNSEAYEYAYNALKSAKSDDAKKLIYTQINNSKKLTTAEKQQLLAL